MLRNDLRQIDFLTVFPTTRENTAKKRKLTISFSSDKNCNDWKLFYIALTANTQPIELFYTKFCLQSSASFTIQQKNEEHITEIVHYSKNHSESTQPPPVSYAGGGGSFSKLHLCTKCTSGVVWTYLSELCVKVKILGGRYPSRSASSSSSSFICQEHIQHNVQEEQIA